MTYIVDNKEFFGTKNPMKAMKAGLSLFSEKFINEINDVSLKALKAPTGSCRRFHRRAAVPGSRWGRTEARPNAIPHESRFRKLGS
ncbi:hypothetical protein [Aureimonas pseudogalii]|uniref:Uncharacterized protein n=1 Tax=Aureimonas pseudogalii TaxID=1744844 RepID=A0A7W6E9C6_9HYPH|nr:hypothetical protein [Aureimonas pseudogalii]MBB3997150.1 hypothetical protein [Aureimonas pseudogalii]